MSKIAKIGFSVIFLLVVAALLAAAYFYREYREIEKNPNKVAEDEIKNIVAAMNKFTDLPKDETPTLATITDKEKLKGQDFFKNSENGDKVVIYTNSKKVILWRPSAQKIVEFAPLLVGDSSQQSIPDSNLEKTN